MLGYFYGALPSSLLAEAYPASGKHSGKFMRAVSNLFSWSSSLDLLVQKQAAICHQTLYRSAPERFWKHVAVTGLKRGDGGRM